MEIVQSFCDLSTIAFTAIFKVPQILTLIKSKTPGNVSTSSVLIELIGYLIVYVYNYVNSYALSSYFEYILAILQDYILVVLLLQLSGKLNVVNLGSLGLMTALFYGFTIDIPFPGVMSILIHLAIPISAFSKIIQLRAVWSKRSADGVSILTWSLAGYTAGARLITNMMKGDIPLSINSLVATILNIAMVLSSMHFQNQAKLKTDEMKKEK